MQNQSSYVDVTIDHTKIDGDLTDFTITLCWYGLGAVGYDVGSVPEEMITLGNPYACNSDGSDVRATDATGTTEYPIEIVTCEQNADSSYSKFQAHIKVPSISSAVDTVFRVYYGDPTATMYGVTDTYGRNNVWTSYDKAVFHLNEAAGVGARAVDSTGSGYNGVPLSAGTFPNQSSGHHLYGYYCYFNSANSDHYIIDDTVSVDRFDIVGDVSIMALAHPGTSWNNSNQCLLARGQEWSRIRRNGTADAIGVSRVSGANTYVTNNATALADGLFHHVCYNFKRSTGVANVWVDAVAGTSDTHASDTSTSGKHLWIGQNEDALARVWEGYLKEIRISTISRSDAWIKAEYWDTTQPEFLMSVGTPVRIGLVNKSDHIIGLGHSIGFNIGFDREL